MPDEPEPYVEAFREIERSRRSERELAHSHFTKSMTNGIDRSQSLRSYLNIFGTIKSVSPNMSIDPRNFKTMKNSESLQDVMNGSFLQTKEELEALKGRDVGQATELLKLIHSPKTAPTAEETFKHSRHLNSPDFPSQIDEQHVHEEISKLKSYYKSAQSIIADEMSRKAHNSRMNKVGGLGLAKSMSYNGWNGQAEQEISEMECPPFREKSVHMSGTFKQNLFNSQLSLF